MYDRKTKDCAGSWTFQHKFWPLCLLLWWCLPSFITSLFYKLWVAISCKFENVVHEMKEISSVYMGDLSYSYFQTTKLTTSAVTWEVPDSCTLSCWMYNESVWNEDTSLIACPSCSMERAKLSNSASLLFSCALRNFLSLPSDNNSRVAFLKWITFSVT